MKPLRVVLTVLLLVVLVSGGTYLVWTESSPQSTCEGCHEIQSAANMWARSGHRDFTCKECHGTALSAGLHSIVEKGKMLIDHFSGTTPHQIVLDETNVLEMVQQCRRCHGMEYAKWTSGGHSATYAAIFLNGSHNAAEQLNADCLRCHGMFYEGKIENLVAPLSRTGPWKLLPEGKADQPVIPCLACHLIHREGMPAVRPRYEEPASIFYEAREAAPKVALYDRYEKIHVLLEDLPAPAPREGIRKVNVSDDQRQRVCVQCHAPDAFQQAGSNDDRTPRGVHEGLSCLSCHDPHSGNPRQSCADCHPAISNCGRDVTTMNTTFASKTSVHNIHSVGCAECHTKGVPQRSRR